MHIYAEIRVFVVWMQRSGIRGEIEMMNPDAILATLAE